MKKSMKAAAFLLAMSSLAMSAAHAEVIYYFNKTGFYSGSNITDANTFATATFTSGADNTVTLQMSALQGLDSGAYVNDWAFNLVSGSSIKKVDVVGTPVASTVEYTGNTGNFFGTQNDYELQFHFTNNNPGQIQQGATSTYTLTGTNLTENSFATASNGLLGAAVHVQGYTTINGQGTTTSGVFTGSRTDSGGKISDIPEPSSIALFGLGLLGVVTAARRKAGKSKIA